MAIKIDESRVYVENGEVKVRHIINESGDIDMTPHPTESRIFVKDGEIVTILSEEIENNDTMSLEMARALLHESMRKEYQLHDLQY
ncbi:MAG: hypothetical protein HUK14_03510 [Muribaculaceae bacterium]|nr:hypothetical protein [Muribaculaceae bacterium]